MSSENNEMAVYDHGNEMTIYNPPMRGMYTVKVIQHGEHPSFWGDVWGWVNKLGHWIEDSGYRAGSSIRNAMQRIQAVDVGADWFGLHIDRAWDEVVWSQLEEISGFKLKTIIPWDNGLTNLRFYRV